MRKVVLTMAVACTMWSASAVRAHVEFNPVTLNGAQEAPDPVNTTATGTATVEVDPSQSANNVTYTLNVTGLTGPAVAGHLHKGALGVAGDVIVALPNLPAGTDGSASGAFTLSGDNLQALYAGGTYLNLHTADFPAGEIRGQVVIKAGACSCEDSKPKGFRKCVAKEVKKLSKEDKKRAGIKALLAASKLSQCGKAKGKKRQIACCLDRTPDEGIVSDSICAFLPAAKCTAKGGAQNGDGKSCATACSPSGAFLDDPAF